MKNLNTPEFWDENFEREYCFYKDKKAIISACDWRWNDKKFSKLGVNIGFTGKLLDIGCGLGHFCRYIKARNIDIDVTGIDFSKYAIRKAKELRTRLKIRFDVGDAQNLPYKDDSFNYVISSDLIEHLDNPDKHLLEIKRILKKNGRAFIITPWRGLMSNDLMSVEHIQEWTPVELKKLTNKYFEGGEFHIPQVLVDRISNQVTNIYWFMIALTK